MVRNKEKIERKALLHALLRKLSFTPLHPHRAVQADREWSLWLLHNISSLQLPPPQTFSLVWCGVSMCWAFSSPSPPSLTWRPPQAAICSITVSVLQKQQPASTWSCQKTAKRLSAQVPGVPPHLFVLFKKVLLIFKINFLDITLMLEFRAWGKRLLLIGYKDYVTIEN